MNAHRATLALVSCFLTCFIVKAGDFSFRLAISEPSGPYTREHWKQDWPGCKFEDGVAEGHVAVHQLEGKRWLRVNCEPGQIGPEKGGAGWRWPFPGQEKAQLQYTVRFDPQFDFVKGGKLPGLSGGPLSVTGGRPADGHNGFSARIMWRRDGRGEAYVYHLDQKGDFGDSIEFPSDFRFLTGESYHFRLIVGMNQGTLANGILSVSVSTATTAERMLVNKTNLRWRKDDAFQVDSVLFEVFHGGGDRSWAPSRPCFVDFTDLQVGTAR